MICNQRKVEKTFDSYSHLDLQSIIPTLVTRNQDIIYILPYKIVNIFPWLFPNAISRRLSSHIFLTWTYCLHQAVFFPFGPIYFFFSQKKKGAWAWFQLFDCVISTFNCDGYSISLLPCKFHVNWTGLFFAFKIK